MKRVKFYALSKNLLLFDKNSLLLEGDVEVVPQKGDTLYFEGVSYVVERIMHKIEPYDPEEFARDKRMGFVSILDHETSIYLKKGL